MLETPWLPLEAALASADMQPVAELRNGAIGGSGSGSGSGSGGGKGKAGGKAPAGIPPQGSVRRVGFSAAGMGMKVIVTAFNFSCSISLVGDGHEGVHHERLNSIGLLMHADALVSEAELRCWPAASWHLLWGHRMSVVRDES